MLILGVLKIIVSGFQAIDCINFLGIAGNIKRCQKLS
jgi:hypothetical protein